MSYLKRKNSKVTSNKLSKTKKIERYKLFNLRANNRSYKSDMTKKVVNLIWLLCMSNLIVEYRKQLKK